jgi:hypothetical protein
MWTLTSDTTEMWTVTFDPTVELMKVTLGTIEKFVVNCETTEWLM